MKGLEQEYSPLAAAFWCIFAVGFFVLLVTTMPPIIVAASYTAMSIVLYRVSHATITRTNLQLTDFSTTVFSFICAAVWPLYFFFGFCLFLRRAIRRE